MLNILAQIDFRYHKSATRETIRVDSIESTQIATFSIHTQSPVALQTLSLAQINFCFYESTTRRFVSIRSNGQKSQHFIDESTLVGCIGQPSKSTQTEILCNSKVLLLVTSDWNLPRNVPQKMKHFKIYISQVKAASGWVLKFGPNKSNEQGVNIAGCCQKVTHEIMMN